MTTNVIILMVFSKMIVICSHYIQIYNCDIILGIPIHFYVSLNLKRVVRLMMILFGTLQNMVPGLAP